MQHIPRKRFGQNFLIDQNIVSKILTALDAKETDELVEIGPGLAALTRPLIERKLCLRAIEIDRDIAAQLAVDFPPERLVIHNEDALKFNFSTLGKQLRVFGNLPYNISTPLLFHLVDYVDYIKDVHVMLQKEVADRMVATPASSDYGRLSVMLQYRFRVEKLFNVSPQSFRPIPKVISSFVRLIPKTDIRPSAEEFTLFSQLVTKAFGQRRKILGNALSGLLDTNDFMVLGLDRSARAETVSVERFVAVADYLNRVKKAH